MKEKLNAKISRMADESPFTNGIMEWYNQIFAEAFYKTSSDVKCELKVALAWEISAKKVL